MSEQAPRPGQATLAGWLIIGGSIVLVLTAWERISGLGSMETQEELARVLDRPPFQGTGMSVSSLQTLVKVLCMVGAAAATAAVFLAVEALRRSRQARIALSVLAPFVLVGGFATAGLFGPIVVAGIAMLWLQPSRNWFAGLPLPEPVRLGGPRGLDRREEGGGRTSEVTHRPEPEPEPERAPEPERGVTPTPGAQPGPYVGYGAPAPSPYAGAPRAPGAPRPDRRPGALVWACVLVWVSTALVAGMLALTALVLGLARDEVFAELERQQGPGALADFGLTEDDVVMGTFVMTAVAVPWCVAAAVLAFLAIRRVGWARIALVVSSVASGLLMLALAIANPLLVLFVGAAVTTAVLLLRSDVAAWFRR